MKTPNERAGTFQLNRIQKAILLLNAYLKRHCVTSFTFIFPETFKTSTFPFRKERKKPVFMDKSQRQGLSRCSSTTSPSQRGPTASSVAQTTASFRRCQLGSMAHCLLLGVHNLSCKCSPCNGLKKVPGGLALVILY